MDTDSPASSRDVAAPTPLDALRAALAWQLEAGVDEALEAVPIDRAAAARERSKPTRTAPPAAIATPEPEEADPVAAATAAAAAAMTLDALDAALTGFDAGDLKAGARRAVLADGTPGARVMVVGEAPGREEDRLGAPFVGRSGQLLDRMLAAIGVDRRAEAPESGAYITNVIPYRPLDNRTPDDREVALFAPFTLRRIELARPAVVLCLGNVPAKQLMGAQTGITRFRGAWRDVAAGAVKIRALATFHPAYLLRSPDMKRMAWRDLLSLRAELDAETRRDDGDERI